MRDLPAALRPDGPGRPDPATGVGVTLLVAGGRVHDLDASLEVLAHSALALYGADVPAELRAELGRLGAAGAQVRADIDPSGVARVRSAPFAPPAPGGAPVELVPFVLTGGLGAHDWADRRLARDLARRAGTGSVALLVEPDGEVIGPLDGLLAVLEDGRLLSPPRDERTPRRPFEGRLPPADEERLDLDRLAAAADVVVLDALHGARRAQLRREPTSPDA